MRIITVSCKRCGKEVSAAARSLLGLDTLKSSFGVLCQDCVTQEEQYALLREQGEALAEKKTP